METLKVSRKPELTLVLTSNSTSKEAHRCFAATCAVAQAPAERLPDDYSPDYIFSQRGGLLLLANSEEPHSGTREDAGGLDLVASLQLIVRRGIGTAREQRRIETTAEATRQPEVRISMVKCCLNRVDFDSIVKGSETWRRVSW